MGQILFLRVFLGERELEHKLFTRDKVVIGRDPYSDLYLEDPEVSRIHASIERGTDGFMLVDHSSNGTVLNGKKVQSSVLGDEDLLGLGRFQVQVEFHGDDTDVSLIARRGADLEESDQTIRKP